MQFGADAGAQHFDGEDFVQFFVQREFDFCGRLDLMTGPSRPGALLTVGLVVADHFDKVDGHVLWSDGHVFLLVLHGEWADGVGSGLGDLRFS